MEAALKWGTRLKTPAAQFLLGIIAVALTTYFCFWLGFGLGRTSFAYVILIALVSLLGSFSVSVILSIVAVACLNYFFVPPLFEFRVDDPDDVVRLAAFFTTSLVVTALTTKLRASEARFRAFVDHATDAFYLLDAQLTVLDINRQACASLGCGREDLIGTHLRDFDSGLDEASLQRLRERILAGETVTFETRHRRKDGTSFPVEIRVSQFEQSGRRFLCLVRDITARKKAEDELRTSEGRFRSLVDHATDSFFLFDEHQALLDVNKQACDSLGYSREEMIGMHPRDFDAALDKSLIARIGKQVNTGQTVTFETLHRRKDGTVFPVEVRARQFQHGARQFRLSLVRDITERKRAEDELRASEERFRTLVQFSFDVYWESDAQHRFTRQEFSEGLADAPPPRSEIGKTRWEVPYLEPDAEAWRKHRETLDAHLSFRDFELVRPTPDGGKRYVSVSGLPVFDKTGRFAGYRGVGRHITERKRAEEALRRSESYLSEAQQLSHTGTIAFTATGPLYWSEESYRIWDLDPLQGLPDLETVLQRIHPDDRDKAHKEVFEALHQRRRYAIEFRIVLPDGTVKNLESVGRPLVSAAGEEMIATHIDVTERKRVDEALRRSESYLAEAQRLSHTGTLAGNTAGPLYWSQENYRIWGFDPLQGLPNPEAMYKRIHPDDREKVNLEINEALRQKAAFAVEFRIVFPDGTLKHIESNGHPLLSKDGELVEMIATHVDVTERKRAQEEHERLRDLESDLAHVNRLSMMGELAASLAHEILHPIATARNNARAGMRFLEMSPPNLPEVKEALACIVRDADRAKGIVDRMRDHVKKAPARSEPFDLNEAIEQVIEMVQNAIAKNKVSVRPILNGTLPVYGDRVQLQQVVLNLTLNAVEAMSSVETRLRELSISTTQGHTGEILVAVQDSGPGIDPERLDQVFAPFYTTKNTGMGMGLSICRSIITAHGGRLWAEANRPGGAIFQFTLPAGAEAS